MRASLLALGGVAAVLALGSAWGYPFIFDDPLGYNATFVDFKGVHPASVTISGPCVGTVTVTAEIYPPLTGGPVRTITVQGESIMVPNLCEIGCLGCPVPFTWTIVGEDVALEGGGVAGFARAVSLQGKLDGGAVEIRSVSLDFLDYVSLDLPPVVWGV